MSDLSDRIAQLSPEQRKLLEQKIALQKQQKSSAPAAIPKRDTATSIPLSFAQQRLWFLNRFEEEDLANQIPLVLKLRGELDVNRLERAVSMIVERHEALRTKFAEIDGVPVQLVCDAQPVRLDKVDVAEEEAQSVAREIATAPFTLTDEPPVRFALLRIDDRESWFLMVSHHIVNDGWSLNNFQNELVCLYTGDTEALPDLAIQYPDYAHWQRNNASDLKSQLDYWREKLDNPPQLDLATDHPRPATMRYTGGRIRSTLPLALVEALQNIARENGATLFMVFLAALNILVGRYSGQRDISIGSPSAGRTRSDLENLIGVFISTLVYRSDQSGNPSFLDFLGRVRETTLGAFSNQEIAFEKLVEELQPKRDLSRPPFFQVLLALQNQSAAELSMGDIRIERDFIDMETALYDLSFYINPRAEDYLIKVEYSSDLFEAETVERILSQFKVLLQNIVASPASPVEQLSVLTEDEKHRQLVVWNDTASAYPDMCCVQELIARQAAETPEALAIEFGEDACTYGDLEARANQLARCLIERGVTPSSAVGIFLDHSVNMVVGLLAVIKAGGHYIPLDPAFPPDRLEFMVVDAGVKLLLTESSLLGILPAQEQVKALLLDADAQEISTLASSPLDKLATLDSLAYVIYTSGSTGRPKGVQIQHRALLNFLTSMTRNPGISASDRLLAVTTLSFDIAGLELFLPLIAGACVVLASREEAFDGRQLAKRLDASGVTMMQATPTSWRMLLDSGWQGRRPFKILCGGEALPRELAVELENRGTELWNMYGPTETTIWSMVRRLSGAETGPVLAGKPIGNTTVYILNDRNQLQPTGVPGELCIGGDGLAAGYLGQEELTAERFIANPFREGERLYRTGDLASFSADGEVEILGRIDNQVKVRGFRIELGEVESQLQHIREVLEAVVVARENEGGEKALIAYYRSGVGQLDSADLRAHLKHALPDYMIPSFFVFLEEFPLTPNGKVDRNSLPSPSASVSLAGDGYVQPATDLQRELATIWEEVLDVGQVGIRDNFFDLGGHSLLALRLVSRIEGETGIDLPLIDLFQGTTIEDIASNPEQPRAETSQSLLAIREGGQLPPFFAIGSHPRYVDAARKVDKQRPFYRLDAYALQSKRMASGLKPLTLIEELVAEFVESILGVQSTGPYFIGGGCEGAMIAFGVATELQRRGERVEKLILWITPAPQYGDGEAFGKSALSRITTQLKALLRHAQMSDFKLRTLMALLKHEYIEYGIFRAMDRYQPAATFDGEIFLARTIEDRKSWDKHHAMGWDKRANAGARVHELSGNHDTWLANYTEEFGEFLDTALRQSHKTTQHRQPSDG